MNAIIARSVDDPEVGCVSWGAIIAGGVAALGVASLLNLLGLGLGLANFSFDLESVKNLGFAAIVWLVLNGVVSMFVGGWVAGLFAGKLENRVEYVLHGYLMWSLSLVLSFFIATTSVGYVVSGLLGVTQKALTAAGQGIAEVSSAVAPQVKNVVKAVVPVDSGLLNDVKQQAQEIFEKAQDIAKRRLIEAEGESAGANSLAQEALADANQEFAQAIGKLFSASGDDKVQQAKKMVINVLVEKGNLSQARATEIVSKWYDRYQQLKEQAQAKAQQAKQYAGQVTEKTTGVLSKLALISLLTLTLGAAAACAGAVVAANKKENFTP